MARPHPALRDLAAGRTPAGIGAVDDGLFASAVDHGMHGLLWSWVRDHEPRYPERARLAGLDAATRQRHQRLGEAFACVAMFAMKNIGIAHDKINVHGGATALGHPIGASGSRILVTLINALKQKGLKRGVASLCIGGGEGTAVAVELV